MLLQLRNPEGKQLLTPRQLLVSAPEIPLFVLMLANLLTVDVTGTEESREKTIPGYCIYLILHLLSNLSTVDSNGTKQSSELGKKRWPLRSVTIQPQASRRRCAIIQINFPLCHACRHSVYNGLTCNYEICAYFELPNIRIIKN